MRKLVLILVITSFGYVNASNEDVVKNLNNSLELPMEFEEVAESIVYLESLYHE